MEGIRYKGVPEDTKKRRVDGEMIKEWKKDSREGKAHVWRERHERDVGIG